MFKLASVTVGCSKIYCIPYEKCNLLAFIYFTNTRTNLNKKILLSYEEVEETVNNAINSIEELGEDDAITAIDTMVNIQLNENFLM